MPSDAKRSEGYVREVAENTKAYLLELQREVERLRAKVTALETEKTSLVAEVERSAGQRAQYALIEEQNANLANLYVASYRLHERLDRDGVLAVIKEILANLIGSEEVGVFELSAGGAELRALATSGLDARRFQTIGAHGGIIGAALASGDIYVLGDTVRSAALPHEEHLTACIPLRLAGTVTGVIAIYRLLPQKPALTRIDRELLELLATHAAAALYCSALHDRFTTRGSDVERS